MFELDANFDKQRRLIAYAPSSNPRALCDDPHGLVFSSAPNGTVRLSLGANDRQEARCVNGSGTKR
jgi:hypothetical protein